MRVFERGAGETLSCGTGACGVALAATLHQGLPLPVTWTVVTRGGPLQITIGEDGEAVMAGEAVLEREVDLGVWRQAARE
jgi:diaminopimelate epimerase